MYLALEGCAEASFKNVWGRKVQILFICTDQTLVRGWKNSEPVWRREHKDARLMTRCRVRDGGWLQLCQ